MNQLDVGLTIIQVVIISLSIFNPSATRIIEKAIQIISLFHASLEEEKRAHQETKLELQQFKERHRECDKNLPDMV